MCLCSSQTRGDLSSPSSAAAGTPLSSRVTCTIKYPDAVWNVSCRAVAGKRGGPFAVNSSEAAMYPSHIIKTLHLAFNSLTSCTPARHLSPRASSTEEPPFAPPCITPSLISCLALPSPVVPPLSPPHLVLHLRSSIFLHYFPFSWLLSLVKGSPLIFS